MSVFSLFTCNGVVDCPSSLFYPCDGEKLKVKLDRTHCLNKYRNLTSISSISPNNFRDIPLCSLRQYDSLRTTRIVSKDDTGEIGDQSSREIRKGSRRKFSLRLRPRLRLLSIRLRKLSFEDYLEDAQMFIWKNSRKVALSISISASFCILYLVLKIMAIPTPKMVPYSDLIANLQGGYVSSVLFEEGSRRIFYNINNNIGSLENKQSTDGISSEQIDIITHSKLRESTKDKLVKPRVPTPKWQFCSRKIDHDETYLLTLMREKGTSYTSAPQSVLMSVRSLMITIISLWIPLTPLMWLLYRQFSSANSPANKRRPTNQNVSFDDVEGVDCAKIELMEIVSCLRGTINYNKLGAKLPRGVLLVGPPGTGKTLLARAVAGEARVPFFSVSASEFVEMFVGRGAARIRDLFNVARKCSPSIIFIDELDAVGGKRGRSFNDERDQTLNQLLTEMDGFESDMKVIVMAATNRPEALDPALCRPGRFSRKVLVGVPDLDGRKRILSVHLRDVPLEEDSNLISNLVASVTEGFVGADLADVVNESALLAARRGGDTVTREDIMEAIERAKFGINSKPLSSVVISNELGKLFSWMPTLMRKNQINEGGFRGPLGYQTLS